jgi:hypothetical protein
MTLATMALLVLILSTGNILYSFRDEVFRKSGPVNLPLDQNWSIVERTLESQHLVE